MRVVVGAALYCLLAILAGTYLHTYLRRRFALPLLPSVILSQAVAVCGAWGLLVLLFHL